MTESIILASASPRRRELLDQIGVTYRVCPVDIDETPAANERPEVYVGRVALEKAQTCFQRLTPDIPVLAADTAVVLDGCIMGKPNDEAEAARMLSALSGRVHQVYSAVAIVSNVMQNQALSVTDVTFSHISETAIRRYWQTGEPLDKAGGYAIQGLASIFIESIRGSFSGVMGLPLFETARLLRQQGIKIIQ